MMATVASRRAALACRRLSRRLLSHSSSAAAASVLPPLLGHFHQPIVVPPVGLATAPEVEKLTVPVFHPLTASSSPRLSLDFVPDLSHFSLYDSHHGLLLLRHRKCRYFNPRLFLVCDPVSRRHALFPPPPVDEYAGGRIFSAALLSRQADAGDGGLLFEAVCVAVDVDRPLAWVASYRDGECRWRALPRSRGVAIEFDTHWLEYLAVRAAGSLYWHICFNPCALALDTATLEFSFLRVPTLMFDGTSNTHKCRVGEMPEDGRLCVGSVERQELLLCVRGSGDGSDNGWVVERRVRIREVLDGVPWIPKNSFLRHHHLWLRDIDAGRTGKVFIGTLGYGIFSYDLNTGKLESLATEDGMQYGHPILPYFSAPADGGSD